MGAQEADDSAKDKIYEGETTTIDPSMIHKLSKELSRKWRVIYSTEPVQLMPCRLKICSNNVVTA